MEGAQHHYQTLKERSDKVKKIAPKGFINREGRSEGQPFLVLLVM
jgi:hypothetical protein